MTGFIVAYFILSVPPPDYNIYKEVSDPHSSDELEGFAGPIVDPGLYNNDEIFHRMENSSVADYLYQKVRILCWIMTGPKNHEKKAKHVKNTWGKRCNILLFMSSQEDPSLPTVALPVKEGRNNLWAKTKEAFKYVYKHHMNEADWFLKADDDTYVILENLRYMLMTHSPLEPVYFGCRYNLFIKQGFMSGGAGYVLSKEALRRFVEEGLPNKTLCNQSPDGGEDVEMGKCMEDVNVKAGDSRDVLGRGRFFPFVPVHHLIPGHTSKDTHYYYTHKQGMDCCSDNAVSFHYVSPNQMYVLEYLIYHLRPYGISYHVDMPNVTQEETVENVGN
ncbi:hypothetical protein RI129_009980 [Pyrocoelia pectoralis]|uniref:Glycoprotein-N-acetylgalactosamine 3-beta-galactosyltransferase 1 n=1 Tax=Pyrocoelia pectoralis TaxID=417401 RepID=A0AAN7V9G1_9COLE